LVHGFKGFSTQFIGPFAFQHVARWHIMVESMWQSKATHLLAGSKWQVEGAEVLIPHQGHTQRSPEGPPPCSSITLGSEALQVGLGGTFQIWTVALAQAVWYQGPCDEGTYKALTWHLLHRKCWKCVSFDQKCRLSWKWWHALVTPAAWEADDDRSQPEQHSKTPPQKEIVKSVSRGRVPV
jgi:hypothetical protein